jgi:hypothetical protein
MVCAQDDQGVLRPAHRANVKRQVAVEGSGSACEDGSHGHNGVSVRLTQPRDCLPITD